jgi:hypothetical protein
VQVLDLAQRSTTLLSVSDLIPLLRIQVLTYGRAPPLPSLQRTGTLYCGV